MYSQSLNVLFMKRNAAKEQPAQISAMERALGPQPSAAAVFFADSYEAELETVASAEATSPAADGSCVRTNTGERTKNDDQLPVPTGFVYTAEERTALDQANAAMAPVIEAVETLDKLEAWVPPLVRGVRALRARAMRETGALNHFDQQYRTRFGDLLNAEPFGPWLLDHGRLRDAVHYLGSDDTYLDAFVEWWRALTDEERKKWRALHTLVDHFKLSQSGAVPKKDRRTADQKVIERVRAEGHKVDAARLAEVAQVRHELATHTIETSETLWAALNQAGPEQVVQAVKDHDAKDYGRTLYKLLAGWLKEPTP
jgi:hypothetical protein